MLKTTLFTALALTAAFSPAQMGTTIPDAKESKPKDLIAFIDKDAYRKLSAPDAYTLTKFIGGLPGNYQTALLRGLVLNAQDAKAAKDKNQTAANALAPLGDAEPPYESSYSNFQRGERSFEQIATDPEGRASYADVVKILQTGQDATDQGLLQTLFALKPFTVDPLMYPYLERPVDVITRYVKANAKSTRPFRLKYTSLAPRTYVSPIIPR